MGVCGNLPHILQQVLQGLCCMLGIHSRKVSLLDPLLSNLGQLEQPLTFYV